MAEKVFIRDRFIYGLILGILIPFLGYGLVLLINNGMMNSGVLDSSATIWAGFKPSTLALMAICTNLIPVIFANKRMMENFIRGMMFPTVIFSFTWFFYFDPLNLY